MNNRLIQLLAFAGMAVAVGTALNAGEEKVVDAKAPVEPWTFCDTLNDKFIYKGDSFVRSVRILGRYHGQWISQNEEINGAKNGFHDYQHRRSRIGFEAKFANDLTLYVESNIADDRGFTYNSFFNEHHDAFIQWTPSDDFLIKVGKHKQRITREDIESSKTIKTVERAPIVPEMAGARPWGITVEKQTGKLRHAFGGWLYGTHLASPGWVDFQSNAGFSYNVSYPVSDKTSLHFDYVFADNDHGNDQSKGQAARDFGPAYEHALALGTEIEDGKFRLISDFIYAANREAAAAVGGSAVIPAGNDTWGFYVLPSYAITEKTEAVFRYAYMDEGREQRTHQYRVRQNVEDYHTIYGGLQHFICGEKFKILGGYEYATGDLLGTNSKISGGTWQLAVRSYF